MKILVTATIAPFMPGGADYHIVGLVEALRRHGHEVLSIRLPFCFSPSESIEATMAYCADYDLNAPNGVRVDRVISLQFPTYGMVHERQTLWLMHQHRAAYELYDPSRASQAERRLRDAIVAFDRRSIPRIERRFANSKRVAERLLAYTGVISTPLYHPPYASTDFYCETALDYILFPSRLETLKRQDLLIEAAALTTAPVGFLIAGDGGQRPRLERLIAESGCAERIRLLGRIDERDKRAFYARSLAVFFGPFDEDYGYVTLEAMLSSKPVITCSDSGGPLEFVEHERTGLVVAPEPAAIAAAIDRLYAERSLAAEMGRAGRARYDALDIRWDHVVERLIAD